MWCIFRDCHMHGSQYSFIYGDLTGERLLPDEVIVVLG